MRSILPLLPVSIQNELEKQLIIITFTFWINVIVL